MWPLLVGTAYFIFLFIFCVVQIWSRYWVCVCSDLSCNCDRYTILLKKVRTNDHSLLIATIVLLWRCAVHITHGDFLLSSSGNSVWLPHHSSGSALHHLSGWRHLHFPEKQLASFLRKQFFMDSHVHSADV